MFSQACEYRNYGTMEFKYNYGFFKQIYESLTFDFIIKNK